VRWLEGEVQVAGGGRSGSGSGQREGQGKRERGKRERGGEKRKKKKTAKVVVDDDEIVEVVGPSGVMHQTCLVLWTWRKLADELMQRTHPRSVERLARLEGYRQPSLSISCKVKTILMRRMNTSSL